MRNSPSAPDVIASSTPPASICAPEFIILDSGSGTFRISADDADQLIAATISATAPAVSISAPPRFKDRLTNTATPHNPIANAPPRRAVIFCVPRIDISDKAVNIGIVASITAANPEGTRCSAQNKSP